MFSEGIMGSKLGMTLLFRDGGVVEAVTAIEAGPCFVTQIKEMERDSYNAVQLGYGLTTSRKVNSPLKGHLKRCGQLLTHLREFGTTSVADIQVGQKVDVSIFKSGDVVDVVGISKGKGFAGGVKRHHFKGGPKTHGQADRHRAPGSAGAGTSPGRVLKGARMAGRLGSKRVTVRHLKVTQVNPDRNLILVRGAVPGAIHGLLLIKKSGKA